MKFSKIKAVWLALALAVMPPAFAADTPLPAAIQDGNILHCFNWPATAVKDALPSIAAAGFGAVQLSPLQRGDIRTGSSWHDLYRPYDLAFKSSSFCSEQNLKDLCAAADALGIKVIVDVVANHVDKTAGYHDTWWDASGRVRWDGSINYGNRYSITHGQLGDYGDINSESAEVQARAKAYVEKLKELGVKGIRWDAAKHIGLPSENCAFWTAVTSVPGMYHYGEILDAPGPDASIIKEYAKYMSVTDNRYCNYAARDNGGLPTGYGGDWAVNQGLPSEKLVYWGESHDTYSNDEWSQQRTQAVIDRAYASYACRNGATALYLSRPGTTGFSNIKVGKGSTAFTSAHIAAVNKFRNAMTGREDWCESAANTFTVTRKGGGAVIVCKSSGQVSVKNGGGYCPAGTIKDAITGNSFTVTASTISGTVGSSGIAVLIADGSQPIDPVDPDPVDPDPTDLPAINGVYLKNTASWTQPVVWAWSDAQNCTKSGSWPGDNMTKYNDQYWKWEYPAGKLPTQIIFNPGGDNGKTADLEYVDGGIYDCSGKLLGTAGTNPDPVNPDGVTIYYDNSVTKWNPVRIHYWSTPATSWPGVEMVKDNGDPNIWIYTFPSDPSKLSGFLFTDGNGQQSADWTKAPVDGHIYKCTSGSKGAVTDEGEYNVNPGPVKPVVTASPASGSRFTDSASVSLTVKPDATIYYTLDGSLPSKASNSYKQPLLITQTCTLKTYAVTADGAENRQEFSYVKRTVVEPQPGTNLNHDYYKVNPNNQRGSNRTVDMTFTKVSDDNRMCVADNALKHWGPEDLICQDVARDIASAIKGKHEYPVIDSYALYAAYDKDNLYLGVQYVYSTWDQYGDGLATNGRAKPYQMDGRIIIALDLDPDVEFSGVLANGSTIWDEGGKFNSFGNGTDCLLYCSTKPTVGTPGLFFPNANGDASYDAAYCKSIPQPFYGVQDGLLPHIDKIWGMSDYGYDHEDLRSPESFTDIKGLMPENLHTFYEWKLPLTTLGITEDHIKNTGIGAMVIDTYGQGATGSMPYDPATFDNAHLSYSQDPATSMEKEDHDFFTYAPARIGGLTQTGLKEVSYPQQDFDGEAEYFTLQGVKVANPGPGLYIVRRGSKVAKQIIR